MQGRIFVMMNIYFKAILIIQVSVLSIVKIHAQTIYTSQIETSTVPFPVGEKLELKISYGWFTIGKGSVEIPTDTLFDNSPSYNVKVIGRTAGFLGFFNNTEDTFDAIIDKKSLKPFVASQNFQENSKRHVQTNTFLYEQEEVIVEKVDYEKNVIFDPKSYKLRKESFDILSSYLYLRSIDFESLSLEDSVMVSVFFGKRHWDFGIEYAGQETIKTMFGKVNAHKFFILFPISSTFPDPKSVIVWTTQDQNQLPLKVKAKLRFGQVICELTDAKNLKVPIE